MPQILELIRGDHDLIRALFDELETSPETRDVRCITLRRELTGHIHAEEATLYAQLRNVVTDEIQRSIDEHTEIRETLSRFEKISLRERAWVPALIDLRGRVEAHFTSEEGEVFAQAERHLSRGALFALSEIFEREKEAAARYVAV